MQNLVEEPFGKCDTDGMITLNGYLTELCLW